MAFKKHLLVLMNYLKNGLNKITLKSLEKDVVYMLQKEFLAVYRSKILMPKISF
ncbi:MAG: hypothetical protein CM15mP65_17250 [Crocinitomicaceae bacterium]|nr:MAG: hypothetical protein CM15mP65_17250 [Crocinitomicaceae bacterium]